MTLLQTPPLASARWPLAALVLAMASAPAWAVSASSGQALYNGNCASCHGSTVSLNRITNGRSAYATQSAINNNTGGMGTSTLRALSASDLNDVAAYIVSVKGGTATYIPTSNGPAVSLSSSGLAFGSVNLGSSSTHSVTLSNTGDAALALTSLSVNNAVYALTHTCGTSLAASASCTLNLSFTPVATGAAAGTLSIVSDASSSPDSLSLSGTGVATSSAALSWSDSDAALSFASTAVGKSATTQTVTLTNAGSASAMLDSVVVGGSNADQFTLSGSCVSGGTLAAAGSCTVIVGFSPTATGAKTAALQVTTTNATAPQDLSLSGTAVASSTGDGEGGNSGGGGCTLTTGSKAFDPVLWVMALAAAAVLWLRRRRS